MALFVVSDLLDYQCKEHIPKSVHQFTFFAQKTANADIDERNWTYLNKHWVW